MRLSVVMLFVSMGLAYATESYSQSTLLTLDVKNETVQDVLDEIEKQTDFHFFYNNKQVNTSRTVSIKTTRRNVFNVLDELFDATDITYRILDKNIILSPKELISEVVQQNIKRITGVVTDEFGDPVIGANVVEKGSTNGTITNVDGEFELSVPEKAILQITYIGYIPQEIAVGNSSVVNIRLVEDSQSLDEVVVIGYGTVKKSDLTGSVGTINVDKIQGVAIKSVDQMLQGRTSGLHMVQSSGMPGAGASVRIRGGNSISGGNEPLYIIDGVPVYPSSGTIADPGNTQDAVNPLNSIPTSDIESIEVLKDASSTAIYGSRGANGVIIITTKRGRSGKTAVGFETYLGVQNVAKHYDMLDAPTFERLTNEAMINSGGTAIYDEKVIPQTTDWQRLTENKNALIQNYQLTLSGGSDNTTFLSSFNLYDQQGVIKATEMRKYAFRANIDHKVSSTIMVGLSLNMTKVDNNRAGNSVLGTRLTTPPNLPVYLEDGSYSYSDEGGVTVYDNPVGVVNDKVSKRYQFRTLDNVFAEWEILKGLKFRSSIGLDISYVNINGYNPMTLYNGSFRNGEATKHSNNNVMWINENILTYTNTWGKHGFTGLVGYTQQSSTLDEMRAGSEGYLSDILQMNNLEAGDTYSQPRSKLEKWALNSYLARINYTLDSKYLFTVSFRADGSSRFGKDNRWGYFPSAAIAWRASEEGFMENIDIISNLKPRVSFGVTGNQDGIGVYPAYSLLNTEGYQVDGSKVTGYYPSQVANTNLKWETTTQYDAGIDIGLFNNRLNFVVDLYYKRTKDLLLNVKIPSTSGYTTGLKNIGEVENKGLEFSINATPVQGEFTWNTSFNMTFNRNKVLDLGGLDFIYPSQPSQEASGVHLGRILKVGEPLGTFYGYVFDGIFSTTDDIASSAQPTAQPGDIRYKDISGADGVPDGDINDLDRTIIGCAQPKFFGGFVNDFSYRNFDLNITTIFSYGNKIYNGTRVTLEDMQAATNMTANTVNRWTPENQNTDLPRLLRSKATMRVSDQYVESGSYLRFQNITLGYNVPSKALAVTKYISSLRIYASLQNFITITSYSGNNPEVSKYGQDNLGAGYDNFNYPLAKSVIFGLNVNF